MLIYFQNRAVDAIVAAFLAAHSIGSPTPLAVSNLLSSPERLAEALEDIEGTTVTRVRELLKMEAKTRDPILSTAQQSFQWCDDQRMGSCLWHGTRRARAEVQRCQMTA